MNFWENVIANTVTTEVFRIEGREYPVRILKQDLEPNLHGFVGFVNGELMIAETVPLEFREFYLFHEIRCNVDFKGETGRCARALQEELERVPEALRPRYIANRCGFFERLVQHYSQSPDAAFKAEISASHESLKLLLQA